MVETSEVLAEGYLDQCSTILIEQKVLSLNLKTVRESLIRSVRGIQFQTNGAENLKACLEKYLLMNGWNSSRIDDKCTIQLQKRSMTRRCW